MAETGDDASVAAAAAVAAAAVDVSMTDGPAEVQVQQEPMNETTTEITEPTQSGTQSVSQPSQEPEPEPAQAAAGHQPGNGNEASAPAPTSATSASAPAGSEAPETLDEAELPAAFPRKRRGRPPGRPNTTVREAEYEDNELVKVWNANKADCPVQAVCLGIRAALTEKSLVHETQKQIFKMPSREFIFFVNGWITARHVASQRPSYVNGLLIHSRGTDAEVSCDTCTQRRNKNALGPFLTCRVLKGSYHNSCSNCKWFDTTSNCSLYTGPKPNRKRKAKEITDSPAQPAAENSVAAGVAATAAAATAAVAAAEYGAAPAINGHANTTEVHDDSAIHPDLQYDPNTVVAQQVDEGHQQQQAALANMEPEQTSETQPSVEADVE